MAGLIDLLPALVFFGVYQWLGIMPAVAALMISQPLTMLLTKALRLPLNKMHWWTLAAVLFFGSLTIAIDNPLFIKIKPTVVYMVIAIVITAALLLGSNPAKTIFADKMKIKVSDSFWRRMAWEWAALAVMISATNLATALLLPESIWVAIKTFGFPAAIIAVMFIQILLLMRHKKTAE